MRIIILVIVLLFLVPVLIVSLSMLSKEEPFLSKEEVSGGGAILAPKIPEGSGGGVTLTPPYRGRGGLRVITILGAAVAVGEQAGHRLKKKQSQENTGSKWQTMIRPDFVNKPWREALDEILTPHGLTYFIEDNRIVLTTIENIEKKESTKDEIREAVSRIVSSDIEPRKLRDPVVVFPLTDGDGKENVLGTLFAEMGMLKATYTPQKTFNLHAPSIISPSLRNLANEPTLYLSGKPISSKDRERIKARFRAASSCSGILELDESEGFRIRLNFEGAHGDREFVIEGAKEDLSSVPNRIARCVFEYCSLEISPEQEERLNLVELRDLAHLYELVDLEEGYRKGRQDVGGWIRSFMLNPDSIFTLHRYSLMRSKKNPSVLLSIEAAKARHGEHDLVKFLEAEWHYHAGDYERAALLFLQLLENDPQNYVIYDLVADALLELEMSESAVALLEHWEQIDRDSYLPYLAKGRFYVNYAWRARGSGWGYTVSDEGGNEFRNRLQIAQKAFEKSYDLNPMDPRAPSRYLTVARGLGLGRDEMEKSFQRAIEADPRYYRTYSGKLEYLKPKWGGSREKIFEFVRELAADPPEQSRLGLLVLEAHGEMARSAGKDFEQLYYLGQPEVWDEVKRAYEKYLDEYPESSWDRNRFARNANKVGDFEEAARQFDIIGDKFEELYWNSHAEFLDYRNKAYSKTGQEEKRTSLNPKKKKKRAAGRVKADNSTNKDTATAIN